MSTGNCQSICELGHELGGRISSKNEMLNSVMLSTFMIVWKERERRAHWCHWNLSSDVVMVASLGEGIVQIDFERRLGPLALACRHWRRRIAAQCVRQWRRAAAATADEVAQPQDPQQSLCTRAHSQAALQPWWALWRAWQGGRHERRERIWVALRVSRRLRVAVTEWAVAAAASAAAGARRGRDYAARYWFARWCVCVELRAAPFVRVEYHRLRCVATQWLRQARRLAVATRWRTQVAVREGSKHLRRRVLLRWYEAAHFANRSQLVAATKHRSTVLAACCCVHWHLRASGF